MILEILDRLSATTKRTEKEQILRENYNNEDLIKVLWACYSPDITWWISKTPEIRQANDNLSLSNAIYLMNASIASRSITGNAAILYYQNILESLSPSNQIVLQRIIAGDLECGIGVPTINKIWDNLIPTYDFMLASTDPKKLDFPNVVSQLKKDGIRVNITHSTLTYDIIIRTRNGNVITSLTDIHYKLKYFILPGETWDGELIFKDANGLELPRKISNGLANKAIRNTINSEEISMANFVVWDIIDVTQTIPYKDRFENLKRRLEKQPTNFKSILELIETRDTPTLESVVQYFSEALDRGQEGIIAKNLNAIWQPKRVFDLVKFKNEKTDEFVVVGWEYGTGKYSNVLGALICESLDGKIQVNVGSGFSDKQRMEYTADFMIGKIVEILYNDIISSNNSEKYSLYLPRFKRLRLDR